MAEVGTGHHDARPAALARPPNFATYWAGQAVSQLGDRVSELALPLTAVTVLGATATQVGLLTAAIWLPNLLALVARRVGRPPAAQAPGARRRRPRPAGSCSPCRPLPCSGCSPCPSSSSSPCCSAPAATLYQAAWQPFFVTPRPRATSTSRRTPCSAPPGRCRSSPALPLRRRAGAGVHRPGRARGGRRCRSWCPPPCSHRVEVTERARERDRRARSLGQRVARGAADRAAPPLPGTRAALRHLGQRFHLHGQRRRARLRQPHARALRRHDRLPARRVRGQATWPRV